MSFTVLEPGPASMLVDLGRPHHRSLGVPLGGGADRAAFVQGNALVGNSSDAVALEFALAGPKLRADADHGCVIFGAPFQAWVDDRPMKAGTTFNVSAGSTLRIGDSAIGTRGYLCVAGGFQVDAILGSRTALEHVKRNDVLICRRSHVAGRSLRESIVSFRRSMILRCLPGPQADWFEVDAFLNQKYVVSPLSNRMGLRLGGKPLALPNRELVSEPVCPGTVQVVNDGQCIILGVDGQTIGGYPKIAQVISADLDCIGQLRPNQEVRFEQVTLADAETIRDAADAIMRDILMRLHILND